MFQKSLFVLLAFILAAVGGTLYDNHRSAQTTMISAPSEVKSIAVYVTGAVQNPGMVTLRDGSRLSDAVDACGGLLPNAAVDKINGAQILTDGQRIDIAAQTPPPAASTAAPSTAPIKPPDNRLVNINTADAAELDTLPGIGPATAQKIIEFRQTEGAFTSPEDIKKVRGIGNAKYEKLKNLIKI